MEKWEYKVIKFNTKGFLGGVVDVEECEKALNEFGAIGWELVSCFDTAQSQGASREVVNVLKRKIDG